MLQNSPYALAITDFGVDTHVDTMAEKRKAALRRPSHNALISIRKFGAGEGIRTLDPNLGKVVLYP